MRTLVVGDIHAKPQVLGEIDAAAETVGADRIVCLGDYLDPVWPPFEDEHINLDIFRQVIAWAERRGDVTLLLGNHEAGYLDAARAGEERPEHPEILLGPFENAPTVRAEIEGRRGLFAWAAEAEGWLLTHAGVTCADARAAGLVSDLEPVAAAEAIDAAGWATWRGDPLGCHGDPEELIADPYPVNQAVGHTAVETCRYFQVGAGRNSAPSAPRADCDCGAQGPTCAVGSPSDRTVRLCFCDTMSMCDSEGRRTGDSSYLLLDDGQPFLVQGAHAAGSDAHSVEVRPLPLCTAWTEPEWPGI